MDHYEDHYEDNDEDNDDPELDSPPVSNELRPPSDTMCKDAGRQIGVIAKSILDELPKTVILRDAVSPIHSTMHHQSVVREAVNSAMAAWSMLAR